MSYVKESMTPVEKHGSYLIDLKIKNHAAMAALTRGQATRSDVDVLIAMCNIVEALYRLGFGTEYGDIVGNGLTALRTLARRGVENKERFILKAEEMTALNLVMELHDAQMDVITIKDMEQAIKLVQTERLNKRMTPIMESV